ncbi:short-chain fatty acyl-CoA regulator family protein [Sphingomonas sp. BIUV-7]|uniref:Short-chain fatty acyl-CoA regulator family protein n=1 Tax=Sphingomonas natans TaxID=3063330 RepID=A0ABT8YB00_9SPHN|nr:helix-turn-helix transcriptional regulator [Sphingomonas sp. BIUV-7]MDO6415519.1 short-chain fatty acyl-CoA regulator family protein [Sphingomonas sp. BIUV-7]
MALPARRRIFAGHQVRDLRRRLSLSQAAMALRLNLSISYLSQIENDDRPLTGPVLLSLARVFPQEWGDLDASDEDTLLIEAMEAAADPTVPQAGMDEEALRRGVRQQPLLARRMVALHTAYLSAQDQLRVLDDRIETGSAAGGPLPWEEVRDWFQAAGNYVDVIDRGAERIAGELGGDAGPVAGIEDRLAGTHDVTIRTRAEASGGAPLRDYDPDSRTLTIDRSLPPESAHFLLAHQLMRLEMADVIADIASTAPLQSEAARKLLSVGLANYAAGALLMPYARFRQAARALRHDIDRLRQGFGVSFEQACHRLSTLQRTGSGGVPFFFARVDMAGNITKRHSATRLQFARLGGACPLWNVHEAAAIPDRILVQLAETPDGIRYVLMAKGLVKPTGSYHRPARRYAVVLGCEVGHAGDYIYADQLDLTGPYSATPIGTSCRICPRSECEQRAFPPAGRAIEVDPDRRTVVPYSFS